MCTKLMQLGRARTSRVPQIGRSENSVTWRIAYPAGVETNFQVCFTLALALRETRHLRY